MDGTINRVLEVTYSHKWEKWTAQIQNYPLNPSKKIEKIYLDSIRIGIEEWLTK